MSRLILFYVCCVAVLVTRVPAADWISEPSYYTHAPDGRRVTQYTQIGPLYVHVDPTYQRSGYRHTRSSLQVGGSVDHYHQVEEWGRPVRPYDEWRFPYRPYSVPYPAWGPPYGGLGGVQTILPFGGLYPGGFFPGGFGGVPGGGVPGGGPPEFGFPGVGAPGDRPYFDDRYPTEP